MTRAELREVWRERVAAFRASGMSVRRWCAEQGIKAQRPPNRFGHSCLMG